jgi:hypothetical protein
MSSLSKPIDPLSLLKWQQSSEMPCHKGKRASSRSVNSKSNPSNVRILHHDMCGNQTELKLKALSLSTLLLSCSLELITAAAVQFPQFRSLEMMLMALLYFLTFKWNSTSFAFSHSKI